VHRDAGARGLAGYRAGGAPLDRGQLRAAALNLAGHAQSVGIVTGFCAVLPNRVTAETDGPPGALFLTHVLRSLGIEVTLIADRYAMPLLQCGCDLLSFDRGILAEFPFEDGEADSPTRTRNEPPHCVKTDRWIDDFLSTGRGRNLSHLVAIERPGPSHTLESITSQTRRGETPAKRFLSEVPDADRDVCHDMHGAPISAHTAKTHRLFEAVHQRKAPVTTIGIGDGGNEIGMGRFAWEDLARAVGGGAGGRIACRIATDFTLIAGVSNWGAYALALAVGRLRGEESSNRWLEPQGQRELIEKMVAEAGAVDGRTLRGEPTVDGLTMEAYLQPLADIRETLGQRRPGNT
jgi:D-glutamate cyclase